MSEESPEVGDILHEDNRGSASPVISTGEGSVHDREPTDEENDNQEGSDVGDAGDEAGDDEDDDEDEDDEEDEEPKLKYARLTQHLGRVYRNGDATSSFLVAGDKMVLPSAPLCGDIAAN